MYFVYVCVYYLKKDQILLWLLLGRGTRKTRVETVSYFLVRA